MLLANLLQNQQKIQFHLTLCSFKRKLLPRFIYYQESRRLEAQVTKPGRPSWYSCGHQRRHHQSFWIGHIYKTSIMQGGWGKKYFWVGVSKASFFVKKRAISCSSQMKRRYTQHSSDLFVAPLKMTSSCVCNCSYCRFYDWTVCICLVLSYVSLGRT